MVQKPENRTRLDVKLELDVSALIPEVIFLCLKDLEEHDSVQFQESWDSMAEF